MKYAFPLAAAALLALPSMAAAEISGAATVGLGRSTVDGASEEINEYSLDFDFNYAGTGNLSFGASGGFRRLDVGGGDEIDITRINLEGIYSLNNGFSVGAYLARVGLGVGGSDEDINAYGLLFGFGGSEFEGELALGQVEIDGQDANEVSFFGRYNLSQQTQLLGEVGFMREDGAGFNLYGLGVNHAINDQFGVYGALRRAETTDDGGFEATEFSIGVDYRLDAISSVGALLSLELARNNFDTGGGGDLNVNTVRLGVTLPLGGNGSKALPLNSGASSLMGNTRSTLQRVYSSGSLFF